MSLKDEAGLVKMYALVDAQNYQKVSIGTTVNDVVSKHIGRDITAPQVEEDDETKEILNAVGKVASIESVVIDGNTHYYIILANSENIFIANIGVSEKLPFIKVGDEIKVEYYEKGGINQIVKLENQMKGTVPFI